MKNYKILILFLIIIQVLSIDIFCSEENILSQKFNKSSSALIKTFCLSPISSSDTFNFFSFSENKKNINTIHDVYLYMMLKEFDFLVSLIQKTISDQKTSPEVLFVLNQFIIETNIFLNDVKKELVRLDAMPVIPTEYKKLSILEEKRAVFQGEIKTLSDKLKKLTYSSNYAIEIIDSINKHFKEPIKIFRIFKNVSQFFHTVDFFYNRKELKELFKKHMEFPYSGKMITLKSFAKVLNVSMKELDDKNLFLLLVGFIYRLYGPVDDFLDNYAKIFTVEKIKSTFLTGKTNKELFNLTTTLSEDDVKNAFKDFSISIFPNTLTDFFQIPQNWEDYKVKINDEINNLKCSPAIKKIVDELIIQAGNIAFYSYYLERHYTSNASFNEVMDIEEHRMDMAPKLFLVTSLVLDKFIDIETYRSMAEFALLWQIFNDDYDDYILDLTQDIPNLLNSASKSFPDENEFIHKVALEAKNSNDIEKNVVKLPYDKSVIKGTHKTFTFVEEYLAKRILKTKMLPFSLNVLRFLKQVRYYFSLNRESFFISQQNSILVRRALQKKSA